MTNAIYQAISESSSEDLMEISRDIWTNVSIRDVSSGLFEPDASGTEFQQEHVARFLFELAKGALAEEPAGEVEKES